VIRRIGHYPLAHFAGEGKGEGTCNEELPILIFPEAGEETRKAATG
jgi:hypothetical protein